jgi:DNA mismatch repair protein MutS2
MREELRKRLGELKTKGEEDAKMADARARIQPGDRVVVERFGYDRPGRVVKIDPRKKLVTVMIGQMKWDVTLDELIPLVARTAEAPAEVKPKASTGLRLEDFE